MRTCEAERVASAIVSKPRSSRSPLAALNSAGSIRSPHQAEPAPIRTVLFILAAALMYKDVRCGFVPRNKSAHKLSAPLAARKA